METEHHGDTRNSDAVPRQQGRVANRVRFAFCSETHYLWLVFQKCALRSAVGQSVVLSGVPGLLRSASPIPSIVFLHPVCEMVYISSAKDRLCFTEWIVSNNAAHFHRVIRVRKHSNPQHHVDPVALPQVS